VSHSDDDALALVGTTVDSKYAIESVADVGGVAVVYRATHVSWGRPVAVKILKNLGATTEAARAALLAQLAREGELLASLSEQCTAIVQAHDIGMVVGPNGEATPYLVMAWLDGKNLDRVLEEERAAAAPPRSLAETIALLDGVADALGQAHERGIAHRDVKPGNLFVVGDPRGAATLKILDFGIAKVVSEAGGEAGFKQTKGVLASFTPAYGAPEQFSAALGATGPWTDVFALALVAAELVSGREPLSGDDVATLARASLNEAIRPTPRALGANVSDAVEAVFARALAVKPEARHRNARAFWTELRATAALPQAPHSARDARLQETVDAPIASEPKAPRRAWIAVAAGASVLALGGLALYTARLASASMPTSSSASASSRAPESASASASASALASASASASASSSAAAAASPSSCPSGMVLVDGGKFFMGSDEPESLPFERPAHKVTLSPFCIDRTEVTLSAYRACSEAGRCSRASLVNAWDGITAAEHKAYDPACNAREPVERGAHPVNCVTWEQADNYCREQGARLPTEAEWELAARGHDGRKYPWGDDPPTALRLNACGSECTQWGKTMGLTLPSMMEESDGWVHTAPVGSFPRGATPYGAVDMVGNVWEWVADRYGDYDKAERTDPSGPTKGDTRVIRGGAWNGADVAWVRPTFRYKSDPETKSHGIGFRCAAKAR
jgi:formylglycine-generating enzyme required for sulfatase activity